MRMMSHCKGNVLHVCGPAARPHRTRRLAEAPVLRPCTWAASVRTTAPPPAVRTHSSRTSTPRPRFNSVHSRNTAQLSEDWKSHSFGSQAVNIIPWYLKKFCCVLCVLVRARTRQHMCVYSTTRRNRNPINRNHLDICLRSSHKHRNSLTWVLVDLTVCFTYMYPDELRRPCQCFPPAESTIVIMGARTTSRIDYRDHGSSY